MFGAMIDGLIMPWSIPKLKLTVDASTGNQIA
jgi:hypothetical protein